MASRPFAHPRPWAQRRAYWDRRRSPLAAAAGLTSRGGAYHRAHIGRRDTARGRGRASGVDTRACRCPRGCRSAMVFYMVAGHVVTKPSATPHLALRLVTDVDLLL